MCRDSGLAFPVSVCALMNHIMIVLLYRIYRTLVKLNVLLTQLLEQMQPREQLGATVNNAIKVPIGRRTAVDISEVASDQELLTIREAYLFIGVSRSTLDALRAKGYLTEVRMGKKIRLLREELEEVRRVYSVPKGKV